MKENRGLLWFWAICECAQFFIQSKLKTPLGKAQDAFLAIESAIKEYNGNVVSSPSPPFCVRTTSGVDLLLIFVEHSEKLIYNAWEGTAVSLPSPPKPTKLFFRTNAATCAKWFWRVRFQLIKVSLRSGHYELATRHCLEYIANVTQQPGGLYPSDEVDLARINEVLTTLVHCWCQLGAWQSLLGLYEWLWMTQQVVSYEWVRVAADVARGRYESSTYQYEQRLIQPTTDTTQPISKVVAKFKSEVIYEAYLSLND